MRQVILSQVVISRYVPTLNENINDKYPCPIGESNLKYRYDRWENPSNLSTTRIDVGSYHSISLEKLDVREQHSLWVAHTQGSIHSEPTLVHRVTLSQVALSHYVSTLNESTNDRYPSFIGESNPKDRSNRWENPSCLSTTQTDVRSYHFIPLKKPNVRGQHSFWVAYTLYRIHSEPTFGAPGSPLPLRTGS